MALVIGRHPICSRRCRWFVGCPWHSRSQFERPLCSKSKMEEAGLSLKEKWKNILYLLWLKVHSWLIWEQQQWTLWWDVSRAFHHLLSNGNVGVLIFGHLGADETSFNKKVTYHFFKSCHKQLYIQSNISIFFGVVTTWQVKLDISLFWPASH